MLIKYYSYITRAIKLKCKPNLLVQTNQNIEYNFKVKNISAYTKKIIILIGLPISFVKIPT